MKIPWNTIHKPNSSNKLKLKLIYKKLIIKLINIDNHHKTHNITSTNKYKTSYQMFIKPSNMKHKLHQISSININYIKHETSYQTSSSHLTSLEDWGGIIRGVGDQYTRVVGKGSRWRWTMHLRGGNNNYSSSDKVQHKWERLERSVL